MDSWRQMMIGGYKKVGVKLVNVNYLLDSFFWSSIFLRFSESSYFVFHLFSMKLLLLFSCFLSANSKLLLIDSTLLPSVEFILHIVFSSPFLSPLFWEFWELFLTLLYCCASPRSKEALWRATELVRAGFLYVIFSATAWLSFLAGGYRSRSFTVGEELFGKGMWEWEVADGDRGGSEASTISNCVLFMASERVTLQFHSAKNGDDWKKKWG